MERFREKWKRKRQDESDTGDKNKVEGLVKKWLVFFEKNLNKVANLDQETCKNKTRKGSSGMTAETAYYTKSTNLSSEKSSNPSLPTTAGSDLGFVVAKTVK